MTDNKAQPDETDQPEAHISIAQREKILAILSNGGSRRDAACNAGVRLSTFVQEANNDQQLERELTEAEAAGKLKLILTVNKAAQDEWRAAVWLLERRWADEFGGKSKAETAPDRLVEELPEVVQAIQSAIPDEYHELVAGALQKLIDGAKAP